MRGRRASLLTLAALCAAATGCQRNDKTVLLIVVTLQGWLPDVAALDVSLSGGRGMATNRYTHPAGGAIVFPTTLSAELGAVEGELTVDVKASAAGGATLAVGREGPFTVARGKTKTLSVRLDCGGADCAVDGGAADAAPGQDGGDATNATSCGNGVVDPDESCDVAITEGEPGACPRADCDDGVACTTDLRAGERCAVQCAHAAITSRIAGDGCCPAGATRAEDPDCSPTCGNGVVEEGETCDVALAPGLPGACPTALTCDDVSACAATLLVSADTCAARCLHYPLGRPSGSTLDGCCPVGALGAADADCPSVCGDGVKGPQETCDVAIAGGPGACPTGCDDGDACTRDLAGGSGCQAGCSHVSITTFTAGDGCCPVGGNSNVDDDCAPVCGNSVLEEGEGCDRGPLSAAPCPTVCSPTASACVRHVTRGLADDCSVRCVVEVVTGCALSKDGCCPAGCTAATDGDCLASCGDGVVQAAAGETCDTAAVGPGACPSACTDGVACTRDLLVSGGTCQARCLFVPTTELKPGDGCCPPGGHFAIDQDCAPVCGNGVVEAPVETCDFAVGGTACAATCPASDACAVTTLRGAAGTCDARCVTDSIAVCVGGDGCCAPGCDSRDDSDCAPICGNGVVEAGEACDRAITAGQPGACPRSCNDQDPCTVDLASGTIEGCTRSCGHVTTTACAAGDRCCPPGCDPANDRDCGGACGDGVIGGGETCDPPSTCPTVCADEGDRCTVGRLSGDPARCDAACEQTPLTTCSGTVRDRCCPTGCDGASDSDC